MVTYKYADIVIQPAGSLEQTATALGRALGGLTFIKDEQGRFDEYPAFIAEKDGLRYALLGAPDPANDLRDEPIDDFNLLVQPADPRNYGVNTERRNITLIRMALT